MALVASFAPSLRSGANDATRVTNKQCALQKSSYCPIDVITVNFSQLLNPDWSIQISRAPAVCKVDIFTCEDIVSFFQFVTTRYTTDFYITNAHIKL